MIISWYLIVPSLPYHWLLTKRQRISMFLATFDLSNIGRYKGSGMCGIETNDRHGLRQRDFKFLGTILLSWIGRFEGRCMSGIETIDRYGWWDDPNRWTKTWYGWGLGRSRLINVKTQIGEVSLMHACLWCLVRKFSVDSVQVAVVIDGDRLTADQTRFDISISKCWNVSAWGFNFERQFMFVLHMWNSIWMRLRG